jgi:hypothetical protein
VLAIETFVGIGVAVVADVVDFTERRANALSHLGAERHRLGLFT